MCKRQILSVSLGKQKSGNITHLKTITFIQCYADMKIFQKQRLVRFSYHYQHTRPNLSNFMFYTVTALF